jgi:hypothetical protein
MVVLVVVKGMGTHGEAIDKKERQAAVFQYSAHDSRWCGTYDVDESHQMQKPKPEEHIMYIYTSCICSVAYREQ